MEEKKMIMKTVSPAMIDQIYRFEALNDIRKVKHLEQLVRDHCERLGLDAKEEVVMNNKKRRTSKIPVTTTIKEPTKSPPSFVSTITHMRTISERDKLEKQVKSDFRDLIEKYCRHDAKEMIARQIE